MGGIHKNGNAAMNAVWKTKDGSILEVRWMDSVHLINVLNMQTKAMMDARVPLEEILVHLAKKSAIYKEAKERQLCVFDFSAEIFHGPTQGRETPVELCMLRAIIDCEEKELVHAWNDHRETATSQIEAFAKVGHPKSVKILAKFGEYRIKQS